MDITALPALSDLFGGADQWWEVLTLLPVLILLELMLSADNAVALAAIARSNRQPAQEKLALNIGIGLALILRIVLIVIAQWVLQNTWVQLIGSMYLFWLVFDHLRNRYDQQKESSDSVDNQSSQRTLLQTVVLLALTDLAFSIDSVAAAVAISDQLILVMTGATVGIIALRFTAAFFIRWLDEYARLETAGFLAVAFIAFRLLIHVIFPDLNQPDWITLVAIITVFSWGFSLKSPEQTAETPSTGG